MRLHFGCRRTSWSFVHHPHTLIINLRRLVIGFMVVFQLNTWSTVFWHLITISTIRVASWQNYSVKLLENFLCLNHKDILLLDFCHFKCPTWQFYRDWTWTQQPRRPISSILLSLCSLGLPNYCGSYSPYESFALCITNNPNVCPVSRQHDDTCVQWTAIWFHLLKSIPYIRNCIATLYSPPNPTYPPLITKVHRDPII